MVDASSRLGFHGTGDHHIGVLELSFFATNVWGHLLRNSQIVVYTDKKSIVSV